MTVKLLNQLLMVYIYSARLDETDKTIKCPNYHRAINPSLSTPHILLFWFYLFLSIRLLTKIFEYNFMVCVSYALTKKKRKINIFWVKMNGCFIYPSVSIKFLISNSQPNCLYFEKKDIILGNCASHRGQYSYMNCELRMRQTNQMHKI